MKERFKHRNEKKINRGDGPPNTFSTGTARCPRLRGAWVSAQGASLRAHDGAGTGPAKDARLSRTVCTVGVCFVNGGSRALEA